MSHKRLLLPMCTIGSLFVGPLAFASDDMKTDSPAKKEASTQRVEPNTKMDSSAQQMRHDEKTPDSKDVRAGADNTETNKRDRKDTELTADQQKNDKTDLDLTAQIRRSIMSDKSLSTNAHNIKIVAQNGVVTLKGPVQTEAEKQNIEKKASDVAGKTKVDSEIEIKP